jgi:hypothetical protein
MRCACGLNLIHTEGGVLNGLNRADLSVRKGFGQKNVLSFAVDHLHTQKILYVVQQKAVLCIDLETNKTVKVFKTCPTHLMAQEMKRQKCENAMAPLPHPQGVVLFELDSYVLLTRATGAATKLLTIPSSVRPLATFHPTFQALALASQGPSP